MNYMNGVATDGAAPLLGHKTGVQARLRKDNPHAVCAHCGAHKLPLVAKDTTKTVKYFGHFFEVLGHTARFYKYSAQRMHGLHTHQADMGHAQLTLVVNAFTRWLSHDKVTDVLWKTLLPVLSHLEFTKELDAQAEGIYLYIVSIYLSIYLMYSSINITI